MNSAECALAYVYNNSDNNCYYMYSNNIHMKMQTA